VRWNNHKIHLITYSKDVQIIHLRNDFALVFIVIMSECVCVFIGDVVEETIKMMSGEVERVENCIIACNFKNVLKSL
jgi:hypothetical protein